MVSAPGSIAAMECAFLWRAAGGGLCAETAIAAKHSTTCVLAMVQVGGVFVTRSSGSGKRTVAATTAAADSVRIQSIGKAAGTALRVHQLFLFRLVVSVSAAAARFKLSFPAVGKSFERPQKRASLGNSSGASATDCLPTMPASRF